MTSDQAIGSLWSREAAVALAALALVLLAATAAVGTVFIPLSGPLVGRRIVLGTAFYNSVLIPTGLILLFATALAPLLRWGNPPSAPGRRSLLLASGIAAAVVLLAWRVGVRDPVGLSVVGSAAMAVVAFLAAAVLDLGVHLPPTTMRLRRLILSFGSALARRRRQHGGFLIHLAFVCLAVGVAGSSLESRRQDLVMAPGQVVEWAGRTIRYAGIVQRDLRNIRVIEAKLEVSHDGGSSYVLLPAQHLHTRQNQWTTEVALHSTWLEDFYVVFYYGEDDGKARLTFIASPLVSWLWASGWIAAFGASVWFLPIRRRAERRLPAADSVPVPRLRRRRSRPAARSSRNVG